MAIPGTRRITGLIQVGIDIGQAVDPSAIVVAECGERPTSRKRPTESLGVFEIIRETTYSIRFMQRLALGLSYGQIAERLAGILASERLAGRSVHAWVDITGVGRPVYEQIALRLKDKAPDVRLHPVTFVHGDLYDRAKGHMGKAYMVSRLQAHLQFNRIALPASSPEAAALVEELRTYRITVDQDGKDTYGAKTGAHDDLATALGLATLEDPRAYQVTFGQTFF